MSNPRVDRELDSLRDEVTKLRTLVYHLIDEYNEHSHSTGSSYCSSPSAIYRVYYPKPSGKN